LPPLLEPMRTEIEMAEEVLPQESAEAEEKSFSQIFDSLLDDFSLINTRVKLSMTVPFWRPQSL
jgi:hypothetical protein